MELFITVKNPLLCQYADCPEKKQRRHGVYCSWQHRDAALSIREGKDCFRCGKPSIFSRDLCRNCYAQDNPTDYKKRVAWAKTVSCSIPDCTRKVMPTSNKSNPLCQHHYNLKKYAAIFGVDNP